LRLGSTILFISQTVAALSSFFLAMALNPGVQATAQAELDQVIPSGRLPELSDRPSLPYIECLMREVLRWNPIVPLGQQQRTGTIVISSDHTVGLPHLLTKDDVYKDYDLPAGSIVMVNVWYVRTPVRRRLDSELTRILRSILRDPLLFPRPEEFRPERFMDGKRALDTFACVFGFGRRYEGISQ
jgi:cytochrome P450